MRRALFSALLLLTVILGTAASCGRSADLVVYSGRAEELVKPVIEQFEQQSGLKVDVRYGGTSDLASQLVEEGDRSRADVFISQDAGALGLLGSTGRLAPLPQPVLDRVPAKFRADDGDWVGISGRARILAYDSQVLSEEQVPRSVYDLTDPKWRGKVAYAPTNASFQAFVTAMRELAGEERTRQWLTDFRANEPQNYDGNQAVLRAVDSGQAQLGLLNHYYVYELAQERGGMDKTRVRIGWLDSADPGALVNVAGAGILRSAPHAEPARRFVEHLLSEQAQRHFADSTGEYPLAAGVTHSPQLPPLDKVSGPDIDLSRLESLRETQDLLQQTGVL